MLATLITILAQNSQAPPKDDGVGIGLILLGVLIVLIIAFAIFTIFVKGNRKHAGTAPTEDPHPPGQVGH